MAHSIRATWYDLPDVDRNEFLRWMHATYLPMLERGGRFAWLAHYRSDSGGGSMDKVRTEILQRPDYDVGSGTQFLMLTGAESLDTLFDPLAIEPENDMASATRDMLARREGARTAIFIEQTRVDGPAMDPARRDGPPAPAIQMGSFRIRSVEEEFDINRWYTQYRLPYMARMPGSVGARKLVCVAGWVKHSILYEFESLAARLQHFEEPHEALGFDPQEWTGRVMRYTIHAPGSPTVAQRIWPPVPDSAAAA